MKRNDKKQEQGICLPSLNIGSMLTLLFFLLAVASVICFFLYQEIYPSLFLYFGIGAIGVRIIHYIYRFFIKRK